MAEEGEDAAIFKLNIREHEGGAYRVYQEDGALQRRRRQREMSGVTGSPMPGGAALRIRCEEEHTRPGHTLPPIPVAIPDR